MHSIEQALHDCLARRQVHGKVSIALSGGVDSMVLLDACHREQHRVSAESIAAPVFEAIHVNHGLSPNADAWALFCQQQCDVRDIPLVVVRVQVDRSATAGHGLEGAARAARYAAYQQHAAPTLLLAQHADDQAETVLHHLLRGTGLPGLAAMGQARTLPSGQRLLRPLLEVSRESIESYASAHDLKWICDESNDDTTFTRNFIRHELMPLMHSRFPHASASLARTARHAAESADMQEALAKIDLQWNGELAQVGQLDALPRARQTNALYQWLRWQGVTPPSHAQLDEWAAQLFRAGPTNKPHQAGGHDFLIQRRAGVLTLIIRDPG